jgi:hypothetical protein
MARRWNEGAARESRRSPRYEGSGPHGTLTETEAQQLLGEHEASGESLAAFARSRGIGVERLRWWQRRFGGTTRRRASDRPVRLLPVRVRATKASTSLRGAAVTADASFEVTLPGGRSVRVPAGFEAESLRRLLAVLTEGA